MAITVPVHLASLVIAVPSTMMNVQVNHVSAWGQRMDYINVCPLTYWMTCLQQMLSAFFVPPNFLKTPKGRVDKRVHFKTGH